MQSRKNWGKGQTLNQSSGANGIPWWLSGKRGPAKQETRGLIPGLGRFPGDGNGNPLQYSSLGNAMDRGAWWLQSMGLQSWTQLRN